jgi:flavin-dependent dehydrogenase
VVSTPTWDVIVAGAGPGGTSTAILLAEAGVRVLVLEREHFPRFHVGESLLPAAELIVTALGIEPDPNDFLFKAGAQFVCERTERTQSFDFNEAMPGPQRYAWHVDRARFDTILRDRAIDAGAEVRHGIRVDDVVFEDEGVRVLTGDESETARYFVDATGLDRFLGRKMDTVRPYDRFGKAAAFTRFVGIGDAAREEFAPNNDIRIVVIPDGWLWAIPLTDDRLSIGMVSRKPGLRRERLDEYLADSPLFQRLTEGAEREEIGLIGNFSFENVASCGSRYACVGDSACFIDPIFSSGISLAIHRGMATAERLLPALESGREADADLMVPMEESMKRGYDTFAALVHRFYNTRFVDNLIFGAPADGLHRSGVISVLAGDVFRTDNAFQDMLLQSRRQPPRVGEAVESQPSMTRSQ